MIDGALHHLPNIGPKRLCELREAGLLRWDDILQSPHDLRLNTRQREVVRQSIEQTQRAWEQQDLHTLVNMLATRDHWRILAEFFAHASFFDIETSGREADAIVTLIACLHRGKLYTFLRGENLDDFLDLLDEVKLLVSFNGNSFDVPRVERAFHIPAIPCAHLDLRWVCYHEGLRGGLKAIERQLGVERPEDLDGVDGEEAVWLWQRWDRSRDLRARSRLLRYCGVDALTLSLVATSVLQTRGCVTNGLPAKNWSALLPELEEPEPTVSLPPRHDPQKNALTREKLLRHLNRMRR